MECLAAKESSMKRFVVNESKGIKRKLPVKGGGGEGTFNISINEEISGLNTSHYSSMKWHPVIRERSILTT
jgi:hypothetical protein